MSEGAPEDDRVFSAEMLSRARVGPRFVSVATPHFRMKYVDHCGSCGAVIVTFQRPQHERLFVGCDCAPECEHPHRMASYDMAYAVLGEPVRWSARNRE